MTSNSINVLNPYSGICVGTVVAADAAAVAAAISSARRAWREFRFSTPIERKTLLFALAERVGENAEGLARMISGEVGKTIAEARNEVRRAQNTLRLSGEAGLVLHGEVLSCAVVPGVADKSAALTFEPAGVVAAITPFNYPLNLLCHKLGPAIAAGNALVVKPSPKAPLTAAWLCRLAQQAGFPSGLVTIVDGYADTAVALATGDIDILSFTGGTAAGLALKNASGLVRCLMELGGNDPLIVMPDADLERAARTAIAHRMEIAGQSCAAAKRLYLHRDIQDEMIGRLSTLVAAIRTGDPAEESSEMGPVIDEAAAAEVDARVRDALAQGARCVVGGQRRGTLFEPTLLDDVPETSTLFQSETFGPVIAVRSFDSPDSVIDELDASPYGLQAGIFTNDHTLIRRLSRELRVGGVMVNEGPDFRAENVPFGGIKSSGLGREGVHVTLREMSNLKVVID